MKLDRRELLKLGLVTPLAPWVQTQRADYTIRIATGLVELGPDHIISTTLYNGQFPGPLLRFRRARRSRSTSTTTPTRRSSCTGTARPCRPTWMAPPRKARRSFPRTACAGSRSRRGRPGSASTTRTSHAGSDLRTGQYSGQVGPVYIEPKHEPGRLRPRSVSGAEGVRAVVQPRRRHGDGFPRARGRGHGAEGRRRSRR